MQPDDTRPAANVVALPQRGNAGAGLPHSARRAIVLALNLATMVLLGWGLMVVLGGDGWSVGDTFLFAGFVVAMPWTSLGFWNAVIGLVLLHGRWARPELSVYPFWRAAADPAPLTGTTALAMALRNEPPEASFQALAAMRDSLAARGALRPFRFFVLSDTSLPEIAAREEAAFAAFAEGFPPDCRPVYRRREVNTGFKAGNIMDFVDTHGDGFDCFITLDTDSLVGADMLIGMARVMQAQPEIGILQTLVVAAPTDSAFARLFQFGMRHGLRPFHLGTAWWAGDCGPYWGHNAIIRTKPFREHCRLPVLPGKPPLGGHVLSHDQLEAAMMRRASYKCVVLPIETESYEQSPPNVAEFVYRDMRWCQGNMQYWRFLAMPGLEPVSRFHILQAILMYLAAPAWMMMTVATVAKAATGDFRIEHLDLGIGLFLAILTMSLAPKLAGFVDIALTRGAVRRYGGTGRFFLSSVAEILFSMMLAPAMALNVTIFLVGLLFGRSTTWSGQNRATASLSLAAAWRGLWPQTLFGAVLIAVLAWAAPIAVAWGAPILLGLALAVPFGVISAMPPVGRWVARRGLFAGPEDVEPGEILLASGIVPSATDEATPRLVAE